VIDGLLSKGCARNEDRVINNGIDGFCHFILDSGHLLSFLQSGKLRYNLIVMFAALALVAFYFLLLRMSSHELSNTFIAFGIMEYWNGGMTIGSPYLFPNIPVFHHSIHPV